MISIKEYKCKRCGGSHFIKSEYSQNSRDYKVLPNGKLSKRYTMQRDMPMECTALYCADCGEEIEHWCVNQDGYIEVRD